MKMHENNWTIYKNQRKPFYANTWKPLKNQIKHWKIHENAWQPLKKSITTNENYEKIMKNLWQIIEKQYSHEKNTKINENHWKKQGKPWKTMAKSTKIHENHWANRKNHSKLWKPWKNQCHISPWSCKFLSFSIVLLLILQAWISILYMVFKTPYRSSRFVGFLGCMAHRNCTLNWLKLGLSSGMLESEWDEAMGSEDLRVVLNQILKILQ